MPPEGLNVSNEYSESLDFRNRHITLDRARVPEVLVEDVSPFHPGELVNARSRNEGKKKEYGDARQSAADVSRTVRLPYIRPLVLRVTFVARLIKSS